MPKHIAEKLGLVEGSTVAFKKDRDAVIMKRVENAEDSLREIMSWNPKRTGRPKMVKEEEIKEIWEA